MSPLPKVNRYYIVGGLMMAIGMAINQRVERGDSWLTLASIVRLGGDIVLALGFLVVFYRPRRRPAP